MPLSTVLGAQSLIQPAVCTTATRPASPYTGQAIYDTTISALLIWSGTAWTGTGGLQLITTATCSSGGTAVGGVVTIGSAVSSVTVSTAFSATYDAYKIVVTGGAGSTNQALGLTLGSTSTGYYATYFRTASASSATYDGQVTSNGASWNEFGFGTTSGLGMNIELLSPFLAKTTIASGVYTRGNQTNLGAGSVSGFLNDTTSYTAFTITPATGTMTGGTVRVYGYQNS